MEAGRAEAQQLLLDVLHEEMNRRQTRFADLSKESRHEITNTLAEEVGLRVAAIDNALAAAAKKNARPLDVTPEKMRENVMAVLNQGMAAEKDRFGLLGEETRQKKAESAVLEVYARIAPVKKALEADIAQTGNPWNWQLMWQRKKMAGQILDMVNAELAKQGRSFLSLSRKERQELATALADAVLAPYRSRARR